LLPIAQTGQTRLQAAFNVIVTEKIYAKTKKKNNNNELQKYDKKSNGPTATGL